MMAAVTFSRRKMFWKVRVTVEVPAPDEPVIAMMGWRSDMVLSPEMKNSVRDQSRKRLRSANSGFASSL